MFRKLLLRYEWNRGYKNMNLSLNFGTNRTVLSLYLEALELLSESLLFSTLAFLYGARELPCKLYLVMYSRNNEADIIEMKNMHIDLSILLILNKHIIYIYILEKF